MYVSMYICMWADDGTMICKNSKMQGRDLWGIQLLSCIYMYVHTLIFETSRSKIYDDDDVDQKVSTTPPVQAMPRRAT